MGQAIPTRHPAVVLRSRFNLVRAMLAIAMIAVAGLTAAVVILAGDSDEAGSTSSAKPIEPINYGSGAVNPSTGYPSATVRPESPGTRIDGGPEEGAADASSSQPRVSQSQAYPGLSREAQSSATASSGAGSEYGTSQYRLAQPGTGLDEGAQDARRTDPHGPAAELP
jgi:hypothetical protein